MSRIRAQSLQNGEKRQAVGKGAVDMEELAEAYEEMLNAKKEVKDKTFLEGFSSHSARESAARTVVGLQEAYIKKAEHALERMAGFSQTLGGVMADYGKTGGARSRSSC